MVPAGAQGPGFLMLNNFRVIMRYNPAEAYALAIGHLSDRLRGGEPLVQAWPRHERVLTRDERAEMQQLLARRGFDIGEPDGNLGPRPAPPSAISRRGQGSCRTGSRPPPCSQNCAAINAKRPPSPSLRHRSFAMQDPEHRSDSRRSIPRTDLIWRRRRSHRKLPGARMVCAAGLAAAALAVAWPAAAQFFPFDDRFFGRHRASSRRYRPRVPTEAEQINAPAAKHPEAPPTIRILVLGDSMADWLAYGLEEALAETPEIGIVRKHKAYSGLIRYEQRSEAEWSKVARDLIAAEKPQAIVMLVGLHDRQAMRERGARPCTQAKPAPAKPGTAEAPRAGTTPPAADAQPAPAKPAANPNDDETPVVAAPEPQRARAARSGRIPHREMGRALRRADRRDHRGAEDRQCAGACGSACRRSAASSRPPICNISTIWCARGSRRPA